MSFVCTIVFAWQALSKTWQTRLVFAANRDERRSRPSLPPATLDEAGQIWGGRDLMAGGTWLAVHVDGRVAAVTNRHPGGVVPDRDPTRLSRGRFARDLLAGDDDAAYRIAHEVQASDYNPVNVMYLGRTTAWTLHVDDELGARLVEIAPGVHVLGEGELDDTESKTSSILEETTAALATTGSASELRDAWRDVLRSHHRRNTGPGSAACIHEELFGTVSSATVVVGDGGVEYEHAEGPPCITPYLPVPMG